MKLYTQGFMPYLDQYWSDDKILWYLSCPLGVLSNECELLIYLKILIEIPI